MNALLPKNSIMRTIAIIVLVLFCFSVLRATVADAHAVGNGYGTVDHAALTVWEDGKHCAYNSTVLDHTVIYVRATTSTEMSWWYGGSTYHQACGKTWPRDPYLIRVQAKTYHRFTSSAAWVQCTAASFGWRYNTSYRYDFSWTRSWSAGGTCGIGYYKVTAWSQTLWGDVWHGSSYTTPVHYF